MTRIIDGLCPDCGAPAFFAWEGIGYCVAHFKKHAEDFRLKNGLVEASTPEAAPRKPRGKKAEMA